MGWELRHPEEAQSRAASPPHGEEPDEVASCKDAPRTSPGGRVSPDLSNREETRGLTRDMEERSHPSASPGTPPRHPRSRAGGSDRGQGFADEAANPANWKWLRGRRWTDGWNVCPLRCLKGNDVMWHLGEAPLDVRISYSSRTSNGGQQQWNYHGVSNKLERFKSAARDMQNYRHMYPNLQLQSHWSSFGFDKDPNLKFYLGKQRSIPDGLLIYDFHSKWYRSYEKLERVHTFIQWLFPLPEPGMNPDATPLTKREIESFLQSSTAKENLLQSYRLMLDFYGIDLCDETTGEVTKSNNWRERFHNLNNNTHNNLRITRILKCLGILGFAHYQAPLVYFFLEATLVRKELPNVKDSVLNYFVQAVLEKEKRRRLMRFAYLNFNGHDFVWCPRQIQVMWSEQAAAEEAARAAEAAEVAEAVAAAEAAEVAEAVAAAEAAEAAEALAAAGKIPRRRSIESNEPKQPGVGQDPRRAAQQDSFFYGSVKSVQNPSNNN